MRARAVTFHPVSPPAAYLMLPLLAWVAFATALNAKIMALNRPRAGGKTSKEEAATTATEQQDEKRD